MRNRQVLIRLSDDEWGEAMLIAYRSGLSLPCYVRMLLLREVNDTVERHATIDMLREKRAPKAAKPPIDPWSISNIHALCYYLRSGEPASSIRSGGWSKEDIEAARTIMNSDRMTEELRAKGAVV